MDFKFNSKTTEDETSVQPQEKGRQTGMLVLLLLLLGGFGYIYFFTGLIRPQEQPPAPPQPPAQVAKQPLPARDGVPTEVKKATEQASQVVPLAAVPAEPKAAAAPVVKPDEKKPVPVKPIAKPEPVKAVPAPAVKKVEPVKPDVPVKQADVAAATAKAAPKPAAPIKKNGPWTVVAGIYVVEEVLAADLSKLRKAGLTPLMTIGPKRPVSMHRLFYSDYKDKEQAHQAVEMLRNKAGDGFTVQRGDKYEVYAGSYAVQSGAQLEQQRLAASGIAVTVKKIMVPLASRKLTAGTFTDRKTAEEALRKLKGAGIATPVLE